MPPILAYAALAAVSAVAARWVKREWTRINRDLDGNRDGNGRPPQDEMPILRRDPLTGEWRPAEHQPASSGR